MSLKEKIERLNKDADAVREMIRGLNIRASELSGVAATIPYNAPHPALYFKGYKVILHNVKFKDDCIRATITMPHANVAEEARPYFGGNFRFKIDKNWFE